jgi:hypothetical protein
MATVSLGSVTFNDSLLPDLRRVFGGATDAEAAANARAWVRAHLRAYVIDMFVALKQADDVTAYTAAYSAERERLEAGWTA